MRLLLVHGRAQGGRTAKGIERAWSGALARGCSAAGVTLPTGIDVRLPFYGDRLDQLTTGRAQALGRVIERGADGGPDVNEFDRDFILALATRAGVTQDEIQAELGAAVIERGAENWEWVQAAGRLVSRKVPGFGRMLMARMTADANAYMTRPAVTKQINALVAPHVLGDRAVVVGHSLGSVVAYWVLHDLAARADVPLFVTLGSPLGIDAVKNNLPRPLGRPAGVRHWFNGSDERDPVALYSRLDKGVFPAEIENKSDIHNPRKDPHGISGYLSN